MESTFKKKKKDLYYYQVDELGFCEVSLIWLTVDSNYLKNK